MFRDEIYTAMQDTEPDWLGSFRGAHDQDSSDLEESQPSDYGDEVLTGQENPIATDVIDANDDDTILENFVEDSFIVTGTASAGDAAMQQL